MSLGSKITLIRRLFLMADPGYPMAVDFFLAMKYCHLTEIQLVAAFNQISERGCQRYVPLFPPIYAC